MNTIVALFSAADDDGLLAVLLFSLGGLMLALVLLVVNPEALAILGAN
jgi:hypothetical protein